MRKPTIWVPTRSETSQVVQAQKMARGWKFWIWKVEELYYLGSEKVLMRNSSAPLFSPMQIVGFPMLRLISNCSNTGCSLYFIIKNIGAVS